MSYGDGLVQDLHLFPRTILLYNNSCRQFRQLVYHGIYLTYSSHADVHRAFGKQWVELGEYLLADNSGVSLMEAK